MADLQVLSPCSTPELITDTLHREDQLIRLQFMAQVADMRVDHTPVTFRSDPMRGS